MGKGARLLRRSATREIESGGVWWRIQRINAMRIMMSAGKVLLPGATDAADARKEALHAGRGDLDEWREKLQSEAVAKVLAKPELLEELAEAASATVCAGVTHVLTPDEGGDELEGGARYAGEWEPIRVVMTEAEEEGDDDTIWVHRLTEEQRGELASAIQEVSSARAVRGFPSGAR